MSAVPFTTIFDPALWEDWILADAEWLKEHLDDSPVFKKWLESRDKVHTMATKEKSAPVTFLDNSPLLSGVTSLKFICSSQSKDGVEALLASGWKLLATFGPMADKREYVLIGK